jgi:hypothetical protein
VLRWSEVLAHQQRYEDLLAEGSKPQLAIWLLAGAEKRTRVHGRLLAWLGGRLVTLGTRLQVDEANPIWLYTTLQADCTERTPECSGC